MKLLQLITENQLRGAEVFAAQLSDELAARGHQVVLAHLFGEGGRLSTRAGVRQVGLGGRRDGRLPFSTGIYRELRHLVGEFLPDLIQANGSETLKYAALLRLADRSRPVVYRNISVMSMWSKSPIKRRSIALLLGRMSHIVSVTQVGVADLVEHFGLPVSRVTAIPIGIVLHNSGDEAGRDAASDLARQNLGLPPGAPVVVHVGSFTAEKNHLALVQAFARIVEAEPESRLLLVGDGPLRPRVEEAIAAAGLATRVLLTGALPNADRLISAGDVLALPSIREGLPAVILEAAAASVPTVAYDVGGVAEAIEDGVTGLVVSEGDVAGLSEAVLRILRDHSFARQLGSAARSRVVAEFGMIEVTDRFEALYRQLTGLSR